VATREFLFLGAHRTLDFVNTRTVDRGTTVERLRDFAALLRFARTSQLLSTVDAEVALARWASSPDGPRVFDEAVALREATRRWLADGRTVQPLLTTVEHHLTLPPPATRYVLDGRRPVRQTWLDDAGPEALLRALACDVDDLLCAVERHDVRRCAARDCEAWFRVRGRTIDRVWCSTQRCGGRERSARYDQTSRRR
jgi:predicted RNA-binding Zn ribbon-like protein